VIDQDTFDGILDELVCELPECFFQDLNLGVVVLDEAKRHPKSAEKDLFVMGEYHSSPSMGRGIVIYYGSFCRVYGNLNAKAMRLKLRETLRHEFRHHLEGLSGIHDLEVIDRDSIEKYLRGY